MTSLLSLAQHVPWPVVIGLLAANAAPYLSALATRAPSWATGAITAALALLDGFLSVLAAQGDQLNVKAAFATAFAAWAVAALHHTKILAGTNFETKLHAVGTSKPAPAAPAKPAA